MTTTPVPLTPAAARVLAALRRSEQPLSVVQVGSAVCVDQGPALPRQTAWRALTELAAHGLAWSHAAESGPTAPRVWSAERAPS